MKSRFVYKATCIRDLQSTDHLCIIPIRSDLSIRISSSEVYTIVLYLAIVNNIYVTVTFGWHYSKDVMYMYMFAIFLSQ